MTTLQQMFDRDEMTRLARENMENALKFYAQCNEQLIKINEWQREQINETTRRQLEAINKACEEYQKNARILTTRMEQVVRNTIDQAAPKTQESGR